MNNPMTKDTLDQKAEWEKLFSDYFLDTDGYWHKADPLVVQNFISKLLDEQREQMAEIERKYSELILSVGNKHDGETRHQTALRYIHNAEPADPRAAQAIRDNK